MVQNILNEKIYLIVAIGTDIGKTFFVENLLKNIDNSFAIKPIISGFENDDLSNDSAKILKALKLEITLNNFNLISPWRFKEPVSPHFAGEIFGKEINFLEVVNFCQKNIKIAQKNNSYLFIETAGGIMSPINYDKTFLDLAKELDLPILLIGANYLGSISHILTAFNVIKSNNIDVEKIIINDELPNIKKQQFDINKTIENFTKTHSLSLNNFFKQINKNV